MAKWEKTKAFWRSYKKAIILVIGFTAAAPYLPALVPVLDAIAEAPAIEEAQPAPAPKVD